MQRFISLWLSLGFILVCTFKLFCQVYVPGETYNGSKKYITYYAGNMPLVLTVSHGGNLRPTDIPDRNCSNCVNVSDAFTMELTMEIAQQITLLTGCFPHVVINNLHRIKLDANRDLEEAANGNADAAQAWIEFHQYIAASKSAINQQFSKGLLLDIHGHGHTLQRLELGYLLYEDELAFSDEKLNSAQYVGYSSIKNLALNNILNQTHAQLLKGSESLGAFFENVNHPSVPSDRNPYPKPGEPYFSGGYNISRHGSSSHGTIDGIQIECHQQVRFNPITRRNFAIDFVDVIINFLSTHYFEESNTILYCDVLTDNIKLVSWRIHPNPAMNFIDLGEEFDFNFDRIQFSDATGNRINVRNERYLDISSLTPGVYFIHMIKNGTINSTKFIKL
ncbi:MAG: T9SS type A sorting domain-containing protein [Saprospiraceae bacterium]|nr:T9SS type A sorting domain-containing protein [Saprospiraceae bacterium]